MLRFLVIVLLSSAFAGPALAGPIELRFVGTVRTSPTDRISVFQHNPYEGPNRPTYPVAVGDRMTVTFSGTIPDIATLPPSADGIYRLPALGPRQTPLGSTEVGYRVDSIRVGDIGRAAPGDNGDFGVSGLTLVYDSRSGAVSVELPHGRFGFDGVNMPTYSYNPVTDLFHPDRNCAVGIVCNTTIAEGTATTLTFRNFPIYSRSHNVGSLAPLVLDGAVESAAQVDEPPAFAVMAVALTLLATGLRLRRRRRTT